MLLNGVAELVVEYVVDDKIGRMLNDDKDCCYDVCRHVPRVEQDFLAKEGSNDISREERWREFTDQEQNHDSDERQSETKIFFLLLLKSRVYDCQTLSLGIQNLLAVFAFENFYFYRLGGFGFPSFKFQIVTIDLVLRSFDAQRLRATASKSVESITTDRLVEGRDVQLLLTEESGKLFVLKGRPTLVDGVNEEDVEDDQDHGAEDRKHHRAHPGNDPVQWKWRCDMMMFI